MIRPIPLLIPDILHAPLHAQPDYLIASAVIKADADTRLGTMVSIFSDSRRCKDSGTFDFSYSLNFSESQGSAFPDHSMNEDGNFVSTKLTCR